MPSPLGPDPAPERVIDYVIPIVRMAIRKWDDETTIGMKISKLQESWTSEGLPTVGIDWAVSTSPSKHLHLTYSVGAASKEDQMHLEDPPPPPSPP